MGELESLGGEEGVPPTEFNWKFLEGKSKQLFEWYSENKKTVWKISMSSFWGPVSMFQLVTPHLSTPEKNLFFQILFDSEFIAVLHVYETWCYNDVRTDL